MKISVILVARNEEKFIVNCIKSIEKQFKNTKIPWELILVDGLSEDKTKEKAISYLQERNIPYKILDNPKKILASGWNLGIKASEGEVVIRIDVHAQLADGYIRTGLSELRRRKHKNVVAVGGILKNAGKGFLGKIIADLFSSKFGVGNSKFRTGLSKPEYTDTVVFALYWKWIFDVAGYFNENLGRNQDIEFHKRVTKLGYKLLTHPGMKAIYYVRNDLISLIKKAIADGYWIVYSGFYLRHIIPSFFVLYLISLLGGYFILGFKYFVPLIAYVILSFYYALRDGTTISSKLILPILFLIFHTSYGIGTLKALFNKFLKGI